MANENAVTNIADLWVAAAMNVDNEDPFESESESDVDAEAIDEEGLGVEGAEDIEEEDVFGASAPPPALRNNRFSRRESHTSIHSQSKRSSFSTARRSTVLGSPRHPSSSGRPSFARHRSSQLSPALTSDEQATLHRRSSTSVPTIFSHVGVRMPSAVLEAQQLLAQSDEQGPVDSLTPIMETQRFGQDHEQAQELENEPSLMSQLPILIIIQYGLLALHSTTHDQVFYLYLVS